MNKEISYTIAKLLKDKRFEQKVNVKYAYCEGGEVDGSRCRNKIDNEYSAPTIGEVVMWLYEKYNIWIESQHCGTFNEFTFKISKLNKKNIKKEPHYVNDFGKGFNSPIEAYEKAIEHALNNLI